MELYADKAKVMKISRQPSPLQTEIDQKQLENVEYLNCLGNVITSDAKCTCEIDSRIAIAKVTFSRKKNLHQ
jgi:hypothetical protein